MKPAVLAGAALVVFAAGVGSGWTANGWRLSGQHQEAIAAMQVQIEARDESIREQNKGVTAALAATASADERRKVAEKYAAGIMKNLDAQSAAVTGSKQTTCDGVLREAWENWK